jgi:hypothetical protein
MRMLILATALVALFWPGAKSQAAIYEGPWCAFIPTGEDSTSERCDMRSFEMCLQEIRGTGGTCGLNPHYRGPAGEPRQKAKRQRARD